MDQRVLVVPLAPVDPLGPPVLPGLPGPLVPAGRLDLLAHPDPLVRVDPVDRQGLIMLLPFRPVRHLGLVRLVNCGHRWHDANVLV